MNVLDPQTSIHSRDSSIFMHGSTSTHHMHHNCTTPSHPHSLRVRYTSLETAYVAQSRPCLHRHCTTRSKAPTVRADSISKEEFVLILAACLLRV
jgi:hypothetical protein